MKIASNKIADLIQFYKDQLDGLYDAGELHAIIELVLYHYLGFSKTEVLTRQDENLNQSDVLKIYDCCKALATGAPVQYVLGVAEFYGMNFKVNASVLIPRPETEELVDLIVKEFKMENGRREEGRWTRDARYKTQDARQKIQDRIQDTEDKIQHTTYNVLDIGTGSGCIPVTIKKQIGESEVFAIDISEAALKTAAENAANLGADVHFAQADVLSDEDFFEGRLFDLIVSNPPYIKAEEAQDMARQVLDFEPGIALFVHDPDSIVFYKRIIDLCGQRLSKQGMLYFELNPLTAGKVQAYALGSGIFKHSQLIRDLSGKERFLKAIR